MMNPHGKNRPVLAACRIRRILMTARTTTIGIATVPGWVRQQNLQGYLRQSIDNSVAAACAALPQLCRVLQMRHQAGEQAAAVGAALIVPEWVSRCGHQPG